jgi:nicotinate phosphoribosyltransferase
MIIESLLDTDIYKPTMMQAALHQFPTVDVTYKFKCRNEATFTDEMVERIQEEVNHYCSLRFADDELDYLSNIRFFKKDFIDFLRLYQPNKEHFHMASKDGKIKISIVGPWYLTIPFEVPVLAIVNEAYFAAGDYAGWKLTSGESNLQSKMIAFRNQNLPFADFGTRRRFSREWH